MDKTFIIIPAHNEEKHVGNVVRGAKEFGNVIVVDDGSTDGTSGVAHENGAKVYKLSKNRGKGYALRFGAKKAIERGAETLIFIDADEQHRTEDIPKFIEALKGVDIVLSSRKGGKMPLIKRIGNWGIINLFKLLFGADPGDMLCGFKAIRSKSLEKIMWKTDGYSVEIEMLVNILKNKIIISTVEIPIIYKDVKKGTTIIDGIKIGMTLITLYLSELF